MSGIGIPITNRIFLIQNMRTQLYLTSSGVMGGEITQERLRVGFNGQRWLFAPLSNSVISGFYYIFDTSTNLVMGVSPPSREVDDKITLSMSRGVSNQWVVSRLPQAGSGVIILNGFSAFVLSNFDFNPNAGNPQVQMPIVQGQGPADGLFNLFPVPV